MLNALDNILFSIPPPRFTASSFSRQRLNEVFNVMTSEEGVSLFKEIFSKLNNDHLHLLASMLTSDTNYFMEIVRNKYGSIRVQKLFGISNDVDDYFYVAILSHFLHIMTDKYASRLVIQAMLVFEPLKKMVIYECILQNVLDLARDKYGCIALNEIIIDSNDASYKNRILDLITSNALCLSNDASGNFVIQHILKLSDMRYTCDVAVNLLDHFVELSFNKYGSYIVERLLEAKVLGVVVDVVMEFLNCEEDKLTRLARNQFGNFVVAKALKVTLEMAIDYLFWGLVHKLKPFVHLLRRSHGSNIAKMLESTI